MKFHENRSCRLCDVPWIETDSCLNLKWLTVAFHNRCTKRLKTPGCLVIMDHEWRRQINHATGTCPEIFKPSGQFHARLKWVLVLYLVLYRNYIEIYIQFLIVFSLFNFCDQNIVCISPFSTWAACPYHICVVGHTSNTRKRIWINEALHMCNFSSPILLPLFDKIYFRQHFSKFLKFMFFLGKEQVTFHTHMKEYECTSTWLFRGVVEVK